MKRIKREKVYWRRERKRKRREKKPWGGRGSREGSRRGIKYKRNKRREGGEIERGE